MPTPGGDVPPRECTLRLDRSGFDAALEQLHDLITSGILADDEVAAELATCGGQSLVDIRIVDGFVWVNAGAALEDMIQKLKARLDGELVITFETDRAAFREQCEQIECLPDGGGAPVAVLSPPTGECRSAAPSSPSRYLRENGFRERR